MSDIYIILFTVIYDRGLSGDTRDERRRANEKEWCTRWCRAADAEFDHERAARRALDAGTRGAPRVDAQLVLEGGTRGGGDGGTNKST